MKNKHSDEKFNTDAQQDSIINTEVPIAQKEDTSADAEKPSVTEENSSLQNDKPFYKRAGQYLVSKFKEIKYSDIVMCLVISFVLTFVLEVCGRHSFVGAVEFMFISFGYFFANFSIIFSCVTLCLFFKKRFFALVVVLVCWLALGVANFIVLSFRNTPLAWIDLSIIKTAFDIVDAYIKPWEIALILVLIFSALIGLFFIWKKAPERKPNYVTAALFQIVSTAIFVISMASMYHIYDNPECFASLPEAYKKYGFAYCFSSSAVNRGVDEPEDYTKEKVDKLIEAVTKADNAPVSDVQPNIVYVQLESFFDVKYLKNVKFSEDPLPVYTGLKEKYSSGFLRVPGLGGGTCNAEFEVLTGMSVGMFGTCEYPYKTITLEHTAGSIAYDLKSQGYATHAIHNHTGTFYDRHINYSNLGFDTFIPVEFMPVVERNPNNWAKDKVLKDEIFKCLNHTEGRDFVFAVSVQGHGKYPTEVIDPTQTITVTQGIDDPEYKIAFEYYVNQIHEMDMFVGELVQAVQEFEEPTVLVFYGDHLPAISIEKDMLTYEDVFKTEYVVLANFPLKTVDEDLYAYQLNSRVTEQIGIKGNYVNSLHRYFKNDKENPNYLKALQLLMYDQLYGENYSYNGKNPFMQTPIRYGLDPLYISKTSVGTSSTTLKGYGFTEKSIVFVNDTQVPATYVDTETIILYKTVAKPNDDIYVAQRCSDKHILAETEVYTVLEEDVQQ